MSSRSIATSIGATMIYIGFLLIGGGLLGLSVVADLLPRMVVRFLWALTPIGDIFLGVAVALAGLVELVLGDQPVGFRHVIGVALVGWGVAALRVFVLAASGEMSLQSLYVLYLALAPAFLFPFGWVRREESEQRFVRSAVVLFLLIPSALFIVAPVLGLRARNALIDIPIIFLPLALLYGWPLYVGGWRFRMV